MEPGELQTSWMSADDLWDYLELGDLIEFRRLIGTRIAYTHWAVYIGDIGSEHFAVHLSTESSDFGKEDKTEIRSKLTLNGSSAHVRSDPISHISAGCQCRINNSMDYRNKPFPPNIIYERAIYRLGSGGYNVIYNNCEHFVKECRYGSRESTQATLITSIGVGLAVGVASASFSVAVLGGLCGYGLLRTKNAIERTLPKIASAFF
uniref:LRAT domain-containing protein n=1 Tax=Panagrolaimus superbus TaxID=310955 RepID=A0A914YA22_9BILA